MSGNNIWGCIVWGWNGWAWNVRGRIVSVPVGAAGQHAVAEKRYTFPNGCFSSTRLHFDMAFYSQNRKQNIYFERSLLERFLPQNYVKIIKISRKMFKWYQNINNLTIFFAEPFDVQIRGSFFSMLGRNLCWVVIRGLAFLDLVFRGWVVWGSVVRCWVVWGWVGRSCRYIYQPCYIYIQYINVQYQRGMRHTSTALYVYRASKKNAHEPTANFRINLSKRKFVLTNCLQLFLFKASVLHLP